MTRESIIVLLGVILVTQVGNAQEKMKDPAIETIGTLIADDILWKDVQSRDSVRDKISSIVRDGIAKSRDPHRFVDELIEIITKYQKQRGGIALSHLFFSETIQKDSQLKEEYKSKLLRSLEIHRKEYYAVCFFDTVTIMGNFYSTPPSEADQKVFMKLLEDKEAHPIIRSTAAYCMRNLPDSDAKTKVRAIAESLFQEYGKLWEAAKEEADKRGTSIIKQPFLGDSRTIGRLELAIRCLRPVPAEQEKSSKQETGTGVTTIPASPTQPEFPPPPPPPGQPVP